MTTTESAVLAGGCFWGLEDLVRTLPGVVDTKVGYTGGANDNPTYQNHPGHAEALELTYNPDEIGYQCILDYFFQIHNPTTLNRQGNDRDTSYRSAIFYKGEEEKRIAEDMIELVNDSGRWPDPIVTTLDPFTQFWTAENHHPDYLVKHPGGYTCHRVYFDSYLDETQQHEIIAS